MERFYEWLVRLVIAVGNVFIHIGYISIDLYHLTDQKNPLVFFSSNLRGNDLIARKDRVL